MKSTRNIIKWSILNHVQINCKTWVHLDTFCVHIVVYRGIMVLSVDETPIKCTTRMPVCKCDCLLCFSLFSSYLNMHLD